MARPFSLAIVLVLSCVALAHHGEYRPPTPPPFANPAGPPPAPRGGVPTYRRPIPGTPTPTDEGIPGRSRRPGEVTPDPEGQPGHTRGLGRLDDRFGWALWWEMDADRFLGERPLLEGAARKSAHAALLESMKDGSPLVRSRALLALGGLGDSRALAAALATLEEGDAAIHAATMTLGLLGGEPAVAKLKALAQDEKCGIGVQALAIAALGFTGDRSCVTFLREVVDEESRPIPRAAAIIALGLLRDTESVGRLRGLLVARKAAAGKGDLDPIDDLVRCSAAFALGRIGTDAGRAALLNALEEGDGMAGGSAALALGRLGDPAARSALIEAVTSDRPYPTRALAIVALARLGEERLADAVRKLLQTEPELLHANLGGVAIASFALVGSADDRDYLLEILGAAKDVPDRTRAAAAAALGRLRVRGATKPLEEVAGVAKDPLLRAHAVLALARLRSASAAALIEENLEKGKTDALRRLTMDALGFLGGEAAARHLRESLADSYHVHRQAARQFVRVDGPMALTAVLERHGRENALARRFAADALGWLLSGRSALSDVSRDLNPLANMPLHHALLWLGGEAYLYDLALGL